MQVDWPSCDLCSSRPLSRSVWRQVIARTSRSPDSLPSENTKAPPSSPPVPEHQSDRWVSDGLLTFGTEAEIWNNDPCSGGPGLKTIHSAHLGSQIGIRQQICIIVSWVDAADGNGELSLVFCSLSYVRIVLHNAESYCVDILQKHSFALLNSRRQYVPIFQGKPQQCRVFP